MLVGYACLEGGWVPDHRPAARRPRRIWRRRRTPLRRQGIWTPRWPPWMAECLDAELNKDLSHPVRASVAEESTSPGTAVVPDLLAGLRWTSGAATTPPLSSRTFPSAGDAWIG